MFINPFKLEEYYAKYEFTVKYMLSSSDAQSWGISEILGLANSHENNMWENLSLGYTQTPGLPELRAMIAQELYPGLTDQNILCFSGAQEGIFASLLTLCNPEDHIIVLTPCYQSLLEIPKFAGSRVTTIPLKEENKWRIDIGAIKNEIQSNTKCVVINFPHNPTGQVIN